MTTPIRRLAAGVAAAALAAAGLAACSADDILRVQDPDVVRPDNIADSTALPLVLAGALSDFQNAYNGGNSAISTEGQANMVGLFTDEFIQTESFPTRTEVELRGIGRENTTMAPIFLDLSRARASAERAARKFQEFGQPNAVGRSEALSLAGFSYVLFAENYCSGVPYSILNDDLTIEFGQPQTTAQTLAAALAKFDSALAIATAGTGATATRAAHLARVGRARTLLDLDRAAEAATTVAPVPTDFRFVVQHSENSLRQNNGIWALSTSQGRWGVSDREGGNGLPFRSAADVRVPNRARVANGGNGFAAEPMQEQLKYDERTDAIVLADGVEARLIEAEAALRANDVTTFLAKLNEPRASALVRQARDLQRYAPVGQTLDQLLPPLTDPGSTTARQDLLFRERAYWMYLTSHRLGDLRRLVRQYGRGAESVFPTGAYSSPGALRTGTYGTDLSFPLPNDEGNNPNTPPGGSPALKGCLDRNA
ncbi:hypothetical protein [Roseisolibacter sp. H3M3-2]|uniref:hypothetical protein n=1 Tax=Roseisolibacter sp. H3M3-2 TaxID=3031323 RepID=UPI0023D9DE68|nr:hypothetical protein [Roseisolibacter sp. H3M3-2]MDF1504365.1 hypothetical protein [Roseisolibacter sp. H3M3-2]